MFLSFVYGTAQFSVIAKQHAVEILEFMCIPKNFLYLLTLNTKSEA